MKREHLAPYRSQRFSASATIGRFGKCKRAEGSLLTVCLRDVTLEKEDIILSI